MKIKPLFDRVLLRPVETHVTQSGIYVPKTATERSHIMTVIATGGEARKIINIGDRVIVSKYAGTEIIEGNEKLYVMNQFDILAVLEENNE